MSSIWLYIWRFQPFHNGHKSIIDTMLKDNNTNVICIWVSQSQTESDPFPFELRLQFIMEAYSKNPNAPNIYPLYDIPSNKKWIEEILSIPLIGDATSINVYCGDKKKDSAITVIEEHKDLFKEKDIRVIEIPRNLTPISATQIREAGKSWKLETLQQHLPRNVYEFLKK